MIPFRCSERSLALFASGCGMALMVVSVALASLTLWARIDDAQDQAFFRAWDVVLGLSFGAAVALVRAPSRSRRLTFGLAATTWVCVSGSFLVWHDLQVRVRLGGTRRTIALNQVKAAQDALQEYARDCAGFPPQEKGLAALHMDPGVRGWAGPYLRAESLTDPWGNPLRYRVRGGRAEVWSDGPDGRSGTADDVRLDESEQDPDGERLP